MRCGVLQLAGFLSQPVPDCITEIFPNGTATAAERVEIYEIKTRQLKMA